MGTGRHPTICVTIDGTTIHRRSRAARTRWRPAVALLLFWGLCATPCRAVDDPVRIGVLDDMSGPYAAVQGPGDALAARMAAEDFGGQVLGRPIEILPSDHQNKIDVGVAIAQRWFDVAKVGVVVGLGNSGVALAVQAIAREKNKISIVTSAGIAQLTGTNCSPNGFHWVFDTYALAKATVTAVAARGGDSWFFVTADYAFGHAMVEQATKMIVDAGGRVIGEVRHPIGALDFSAFIVQAQASAAKVIGLANAGADFVNSMKTAAEFGVVAKGQMMAGTVVFLSDVHAIGLPIAQGLVFTEAFYWDQNDRTRAFSRRFEQRHGTPPTSLHAGAYSATLHYLKAVAAAGSDETGAVLAKMRELPIDDFMTEGGWIRQDGRVMRTMYLMQVKKPQEAKGEWDLLKVVATIPADDAFRPLAEGNCPLAR
jgi:branched-chain amino acid transport system substrate-binding protein